MAHWVVTIDTQESQYFYTHKKDLDDFTVQGKCMWIIFYVLYAVLFSELQKSASFPIKVYNADDTEMLHSAKSIFYVHIMPRESIKLLDMFPFKSSKFSYRANFINVTLSSKPQKGLQW